MSRRVKKLKKFGQFRSEKALEKPSPEERIKSNVKEKDNRNFLIKIYDKQYKKLLLIPVLILVLSIILIGVKIASTGEFVEKAVSLKGGTTITILTDKNINIILLEEVLKQEYSLDLEVRTLGRAGKTTGLVIDVDITDTHKGENKLLLEQFKQTLAGKLGEEATEFSIESMGSSLGKSFFKETIFALLLAFLFMGIVVFLYFRTFVPSIAVILAAFSDLIVTLAVINLMGIKLSTAGIAAFLMIIGYSVDTDILLTTRLVKRTHGTVMSRLMESMKTGMTMSATTIVVVTLALIFTQSETIRQIMTILLVGLMIDVINTWIQNAGIIRIYLERKKN